MKLFTAMRPLPRLPYHTSLAEQQSVRLWGTQYVRHFGMMQVVRRVQDGVGVAIGFCDTVTGRPLSTILPKELAPVLQTVTGQGSSTYTQSRGFRPSAPQPAPWHVSPPTPPTTDLKAPNPPPEQLRAVMRLLSQSVVVCTAAGHDSMPRAMTMSSFTSLTLKPTPVITFNVATPSRTLDAIAASRGFNIHILSGDASGAAVADHFTRGNVGDDLFAGLDGVVVEQSAAAVPPLLRGKGVVHVLRCRLLDDEPSRGFVKVRDHMIVVAEVVEMISGVESKEFGLAYADRKYRQVGGVISND
ncbi:Flavin reductase-like, FMN-binding protein [Cordyceps fumosorosea ARSEF 2679]|uniref:Flavin reductase-like, FMN-binding protein n=1 Tax=Cordyceps fumosorosea (strain ARSEF 2679) TaxID=1081104 RepID=A0A162LLK3_CORFA|nr:Flavin reductase-like, FMN-binding protein [Cordyceps fumosorosea ARSEF 2679]OAA72414.1 Flavin reductase-like, FMN-binding protein [Cordyceps fumosorosea ARSEF 2679]